MRRNGWFFPTLSCQVRFYRPAGKLNILVMWSLMCWLTMRTFRLCCMLYVRANIPGLLIWPVYWSSWPCLRSIAHPSKPPHLLSNYYSASFQWLQVAYNDSLRILLKRPRWRSASVLRKIMFNFISQLNVSENVIVWGLTNILNSATRYLSQFWNHYLINVPFKIQSWNKNWLCILLANSCVKIPNYCFAARNKMILQSISVSSILLSIKHFLLDIRVLPMSCCIHRSCFSPCGFKHFTEKKKK